MNGLVKRIGFAAVLLATCGVSGAADQFIPTITFYAKNPGPTGSMLKRKILFKSKDDQANTVTGNPILNGAKLRLKLGNNEQCFVMPAAGWSPISNIGFKYKGFGEPGAVTVASIKRGAVGVFFLKLRLAGANGELDIVPQAGTSDLEINLSMGGGDSYCAGGPTPSNAINTDKLYKVKGEAAPSSCGVPACSPSGAFLDDSPAF